MLIKNRALTALLLTFTTLPCWSQDNVSETYGESFIVEDNKVERGLRADLSYLKTFDNNLLNSNDFSLSLDKQLNQSWMAGIEGQLHFNKLSETGKKLEQDLAKAKVRQNVYRSTYATYITSTFSPLVGKFAVGSGKVVNTELSLKSGLGFTYYSVYTNPKGATYLSLFAELGGRAYFTTKWSVKLALRSVFDNFYQSSRINNNQLGLSLGRDF